MKGIMVSMHFQYTIATCICYVDFRVQYHVLLITHISVIVYEPPFVEGYIDFWEYCIISLKGFTPLRIALVYGHEESAKVLIAAGATSDPTVGLYFAQQICGTKHWKLKKIFKKIKELNQISKGNIYPTKNSNTLQ